MGVLNTDVCDEICIYHTVLLCPTSTVFVIYVILLVCFIVVLLVSFVAIQILIV